MIQCTLLVATGWLAPRLPRFQAAHPDVAISLRTAIHDADNQPAGTDLRIIFGLPTAAHEDSDPLFGEILTPVALPEIAAEIATPADLANWRLIEIATHRANWSWILPSDGPAPRFTYTDNTLTAFAMAEQGGIVLDRQPATGGLAARHGLTRCLPDLETPGVQSYTLVYPARTSLSRPARAFREWLLGEVSAVQRQE